MASSWARRRATSGPITYLVMGKTSLSSRDEDARFTVRGLGSDVSAVCRWQSAADPLVGCRLVSLPATIHRTTPQNETAMTTEEGASGATVTFRTPAPFPGPRWVMGSVFAVVWLVCAAGALWKGQPGRAATYLAFGCCWGALAWLSRKSGVELTAESVIVRRLSRRRIAWSHVQAVVRHKSSGGTSTVRLLLQDGKQVKLPAPVGNGAAAFERDFQIIDAWWRANRGESWRPVRKEEPRPPAQG